MSQIPIIFVHTDAEQVDPLLLRALMEHVGPSYDVIDGCTDTESRLQDLRDSGRMVALFVYDQHGVGLHGADFLEETTGLFTESLAILITTHADTDSAIASINRAEIDYYLVKPWKPAEENLLPIVDRMLSEWRESVQMPFIRVKGIMTVRAIRIRERASLQRAAEIVALSGVGDLMVIDDNDQFVGVLSIGDVIRAALPDFDEIMSEGGSLEKAYQTFLRKGGELAERPIQPLVIYNPITVDPEDHAAKVAVVLIEKNIGRLPVAKDGRLVGTVSRADISQAIVGALI